jgi:cytoplasmic iron level regulating protein YaaA (DUF328/UPF0246 family)
VSCVARKREGTFAAKDLYQSEWFLKARRYVESIGARWYILSALYGLLDPDQEIATYNRTLKTMAVIERRTWASEVSSALGHLIVARDKVVFLAGMAYREFLEPLLDEAGIAVEVPMKGLQIGKQLQWLARETSRG